jgi:parallel beta-helix repeat protein
MMICSCRVAASVLAFACCSGLAFAGPLNPPAGPVAPTHKTLTEVEPRIAITAANTPGDGNSEFRITQPGSYYLTGNVQVFNIQHGIQIDLVTDGLVTIDLNGFSLIGSEGTLNGIDVDAPFQPRVIIRNGFVTSFEGNGIDLTGSESATIENVESSRNSGRGFVIGVGTLSRCKAQFNSAGGFKVGATSALSHCEAITTGPIGIETSDNCRLAECTANGSSGNGIDCGGKCVLTNCVATNSGGYGIETNQGCTFTGCTASDNAEAGISGNQACTFVGCVSYSNTKWGFSSGGSSVFQSCVARDNGFNGFSTSFSQLSECHAQGNFLDGFASSSTTNYSKCTSLSNRGNGFASSGGCVIVECSALFNDKHGISLTADGNIIRGNLCNNNGQGAAPGAGIHTEGLRNRIEDNACNTNDVGIDVRGSRSIVIRNTCGGNTTNWFIVADNSSGPIIDRSAPGTAQINGNVAFAALGSTDPSANFTN